MGVRRWRGILGVGMCRGCEEISDDIGVWMEFGNTTFVGSANG
jgi:hypothetical protein